MSSRGEPAAARDMVARLLLDWSTRFRALTTLLWQSENLSDLAAGESLPRAVLVLVALLLLFFFLLGVLALGTETCLILAASSP